MKRSPRFKSDNSMSSFLHETAEGVVLKVQVQPRASEDEVVGPFGGALKIRITAAPVAGAANKQLLKFLAKKLKVSIRYHIPGKKHCNTGSFES
jgi:uncharacterized protein (TIGR00251 family)